MYDINARNVLTPNPGGTRAKSRRLCQGCRRCRNQLGCRRAPRARWCCCNSPEYPDKNLYHTTWTNFQPRLGIAYAFNDKTVLHASAGIIDEGMNGLSTDWFSFYYNSITMNQLSTLNGQNWISELGHDHGLGTFPLQSSGTNLGYFRAIHDQAEYAFMTFGQAGNPDQGGASTINNFKSPRLRLGCQRPTAGGKELDCDRGLHRHSRDSFAHAAVGMEPQQCSAPVLFAGHAVRGEQSRIDDSRFKCQIPSSDTRKLSASQPTLQLSQVLGLSPQYSNITPGQATWGRSFANFLNLQMQSRGYHGLTLLASYSIRKTLTNSWGKDIQHAGPAGRGYCRTRTTLWRLTALPATKCRRLCC